MKFTERAKLLRIHELQGQVLAELADLLQELETRVPLPHRGEGSEEIYEYVERSPQQALVLLLARMLSAIHAERLLVATGMIQDAELSASLVEAASTRISHLVKSLDHLEDPSLTEALRADVWRGNWFVLAPRLDAKSIMELYGHAGPRFHVGGSVGSALWETSHARLEKHVFGAIECVAQCGVAFGHPGMWKFADDIRSAYTSELDSLGQTSTVSAEDVVRV